MDFSSWKKKCEDGKTCTLVHPKGHTMTIAMKALPAIQREQLKRLKFDEGGKVPVPPQQQTADTDKQARAQQMAQGAQQSGGLPDISTIADRLKNAWAKGGKVQKYDDGTPDGTVEKDDSGTTHNGSPININIGVPGQNAQPAEPQMSKGPATPPSPMTYQNQNVSTPQENPTLATEAQRTLESQNAGLTGIEQGRQADAAEAAAKAKAGEESVMNARTEYYRFNQARNDIDQHTQELASGLKDINPNHYQENLGTGQKVATAIGLALGGFGTPFGGHNYAMDFLNKQIERDVAAQEKNNENKKTIWGAWNTLYNSKAVATPLALATTRDLYARQAELAALQQGDLRSRAAANAMKQKWGEESASARMQAASILTNHAGQQGPQQQKQMPNKNAISLLSPDAEQKMMNAQFDPVLKDQAPAIYQQYTQAQQAEKLLNGPNGDGKGGIDDILGQIHQATGNIGYYGYAHQQLGKMGEALPFVGGAAGAAVNLLPPTASEKRVNALKSSLETDLGTALNGIMTPTDIHNLVDKFSPAYQDTDKDVAFKKEQIVNTVKKALRSSSLHAAKMLPKEK